MPTLFKEFPMKALVMVVIVVLLALPSEIEAQSGYVESWNSVGSNVVPQVNIYARGPIKERVGWTTWTVTSKEWSEALVGLTLAISKEVEVSTSIGLETSDNPLRQAGSLWMGKGRWSLLSIHENGGSGYWYRNLGTYQATKQLSIGVNHQRYLGLGPYAELKVAKVSIWGTYAVDNNKGAAGFRFYF